MPKHVLVTGGAGFIGSTLTASLLADQCRVTVVDNFDPFYPRKIKENNIRPFVENDKFEFVNGDIRNAELYAQLEKADFDVIVHLAARAGVRPSIADPLGYQDVNVKGT